MLNTDDLSELYSAVIAAGRAPPQSADLVYLAAQTRQNEISVLKAAPIFRGSIGINGHDDTEAYCGYPGFAHWKEQLICRGITASRIVGITGSLVQVGDRKTINTLSEMEALARYTAKNGIRSVIVMAPYWHLLRSFMSAVTGAKRHCPRLRIYPALGLALPWEEESVHSQGKVGGIRADFVFTETSRIFAYSEKGDLPSPAEVMEYL